MGAPYHGKNGLIYVSGTEIVGANAWSIAITTDNVETPQFADSWKKRAVGFNDWSGSIQAWDQLDEKTLIEAAVAGAAVALLIYPDRNTLTAYYSGNAIFGASSDGGVAAAVTHNGDFVGNDTLTIAGFS